MGVILGGKEEGERRRGIIPVMFVNLHTLTVYRGTVYLIWTDFFKDTHWFSSLSSHASTYTKHTQWNFSPLSHNKDGI